jgi:hypothetical protein
MSINLKPNAPYYINCKVYPLMEQEKVTTLQFLKEHKEKGYLKRQVSNILLPGSLFQKRIDFHVLFKIIRRSMSR